MPLPDGVSTATEFARLRARQPPHAPVFGFAPGFRFERRETSFAGYGLRPIQGARALPAAGVRPVDRIALLSRGTEAFLMSWSGAMRRPLSVGEEAGRLSTSFDQIAWENGCATRAARRPAAGRKGVEVWFEGPKRFQQVKLKLPQLGLCNGAWSGEAVSKTVTGGCHRDGCLQIELAGKLVDHGDEIAVRAASAGFGVFSLDQAVEAFHRDIGNVAIEPSRDRP